MSVFNDENQNLWLNDMLVSRAAQSENTIINLGGGVTIGGDNFAVLAGPCAIETRKQVLETAMAVSKAGADIFRGGAFKSRTSPYDFRGMRDEGLALLEEVKEVTGMPVVSEIVNISHLPLFEAVDIIQVGERNMRNAELLIELGYIDKPVLLKRSHSATIKELLMSAEYLLAGGNRQVILCERGIRTFEPMTRNTMDISSIPLLKRLTHLPVIADPSHATGIASLVKPMSLAAMAAGTDGLLIEVHICPNEALCDGSQSLTTDEFNTLMDAVNCFPIHLYRE
ncbi:MAG: 3-deoxy-7-phosphoheptulonate synthase [Lentihominibacter sp.]|jgi:3-deoxy-7-phosphoheptulonate synthase